MLPKQVSIDSALLSRTNPQKEPHSPMYRRVSYLDQLYVHSSHFRGAGLFFESEADGTRWLVQVLRMYRGLFAS